MLYNLINKLEKLIEKWENTPYTGDLTNAAQRVCAGELRELLGEPILTQEQAHAIADMQKMLNKKTEDILDILYELKEPEPLHADNFLDGVTADDWQDLEKENDHLRPWFCECAVYDPEECDCELPF